MLGSFYLWYNIINEWSVMKQNITVLVPSLLKTSIHDYGLVDFVKNGLLNNDNEVKVFENQFGYNSVDQLIAGLNVFISTLKNEYSFVSVVLFGTASRLKVSNDVDKLIIISPCFEMDKDVNLILKNGIFLEEINGFDYQGQYYNKAFLVSLASGYDGNYLNELSCTKLMINGLLNEHLNQVESAVFCSEYGVEYLGLEDMDYYVDDFYNREFILEELININ